MITVFGKSGKVYDIGLLNCDFLMKNGDIVRAPSFIIVDNADSNIAYEKQSGK
jgi:hypothetical protein